jgi:hypothetical protein
MTGGPRPGGENRAEIGVCRDDDAVLFDSSPRQDFFVFDRLHPIGSHMDGVMSRTYQEVGQTRRQRVVDQKSQAEDGRGSSRSIAEAAAKRRHSRISSAWRSGYSARISLSDSPPASNRSTVATGIRTCRTQGTPPICAGSTVMRSKFLIAFVIIVATCNPLCKHRSIWKCRSRASRGTLYRLR